MSMRCPETLALWLTQHRPIDDYPCAYFDLGTSLALASSRRLAGRERTSDQVARWSRTELTAFEQVIACDQASVGGRMPPPQRPDSAYWIDLTQGKGRAVSW